MQVYMAMVAKLSKTSFYKFKLVQTGNIKSKVILSPLWLKGYQYEVAGGMNIYQ